MARPVLADHVAVDPDVVAQVAGAVPGVRAVLAVRSRWSGSTAALDMTVSVDADLPTLEAHEIADEIERRIRAALPVEDVSVHIEPER